MMNELQIEERPIGIYGLDEIEDSEERLAYLLSENKSALLLDSSEEELSMANPISQTRAFALFGSMLGTFGPLSIGIALLAGNGRPSGDELLFPLLFSLANLTTAIVGYFTGKIVGNFVAATHKFRLLSAVSLLLLIGMIWGGVSGFAGGLFLLLIGSIVGAVIGGVFGSIATLVFGVIYRYLQIGGSIERRQFIPLAFGTTLFLCAFILGL
jgi:hypothetical protein